MYAIGCLNKYIKTGESASAIIDPNETYFEIYVIIDHIIAIIIPTGKQSARIVPTPEATDLPPLKFKNTGLLCPSKTAMALRTGAKPIEEYFVTK